MDKTIGDSLSKAFEAYKQATIEKNSIQRQLQQTTDYYKRYTDKLLQQIQDQRVCIVRLEAELSATTGRASGEKCCEAALRKRDVEAVSSCIHHPDNASSGSQRRKQFLGYPESLETPPNALLMTSKVENGEVLDTFQKLQGTLHLIQKLTRKQNDHLKRVFQGNDSTNEPQFSMPIQCTDGTAEQAEGPFSIGSEGDELASSSLASRGACQEDVDFGDSLSKLSVRFPPSTDSEYEFLNSAAEKAMEPVGTQKDLAGVAGASGTSEDAPLNLLYTGPSLNVASPSNSLSLEGVRGPQQPLWSPNLCNDADQATGDQSQPVRCAYCNSTVPQEHMYGHLNSHIQQNPSNGH